MERIELGQNQDSKTGIILTDNIKIQIIKGVFTSVLANTEVEISHCFSTRVPVVLQCADGNNGTIYQSKAGNNGKLFLKSTTDNNPVSLILF